MPSKTHRGPDLPDPDDAARAPPHLILELLTAFYWFDEGLQNYLRAQGWPAVSRPESMLMANVVMGCHRPSDIARRLGVSRQAIHATIGQMVGKGVLKLADDPSDGRIKVVELTPVGEAMRKDAQAAMRIMVDELGRRIGAKRVERLREAMLTDWGDPLAFA
ncbi:MAG: MarR family winged helix-turn-helix transcriptional regulator, partial [Phenylobacterium sp.]